MNFIFQLIISLIFELYILYTNFIDKLYLLFYIFVKNFLIYAKSNFYSTMQNTPCCYANVILPLPLNKSFTYAIPEHLNKEASPGKRVIIQFGKKKYYSGIIREIINTRPKHYEVKEIISILDQNPLVNDLHFAFWEWLSNYYMCTTGEILKAALPSGLRIESETKLFHTGKNDQDDPVSQHEQLILDMLADNPGINVQKIISLTKKKNTIQFIKSLIDKKYIYAEESIKDKFVPKKEAVIKLHKSYQTKNHVTAVMKDLEKAPKQSELLMAFLQLSGYFKNHVNAFIKKTELLNHANTSPGTLKSLIDKQILYIEFIESNKFFSSPSQIHPVNALSNAQQEAFDSIRSQFATKNVVLLHGITSSGKTEVYIHLIKEQIEQGKQVLYLLPEIALTTQIIQRLKVHFGEQVGIYHSKFGESERADVWRKLLSHGPSQYKVILGVRSSVFLPFSDLGLIIVDEEHENTYKQFDPAPRYNARDAAIYLAGLHKAGVLLGTATPSIETYYNTQNQKYGFVTITERYKQIKLPEILLLDIKKASLKKQMKSLFHPDLLNSIKDALDKGEQIILFQNRRGFAPFLECTVCGWIPKCNHCDVSLTYHKFQNSLICHYCGYSIKTPQTCHACHDSSLNTRGFGTEKIEDEIKIYFPGARVMRMDLDTTRSKKGYEKIIEQFENHSIDILIGTQMISKGLDFKNVSTVGILNADNMLNFPNFRAHERSYQLMTQVSGRAGRSSKQGKVMIQTTQSDHHVIKYIIQNDYQQMYKNEIQERKTFHYPPFVRLIKVIVKHKKKELADEYSQKLAQLLSSYFGPKRLLGPQAPLISKIQTYYLFHIYVKIEISKPIHVAKEQINKNIKTLQNNTRYKSVIVFLDIDPV